MPFLSDPDFNKKILLCNFLVSQTYLRGKIEFIFEENKFISLH